MSRQSDSGILQSHAVIPESHRYRHQTSATIGLAAGFAIMMTLDSALL